MWLRSTGHFRNCNRQPSGFNSSVSCLITNQHASKTSDQSFGWTNMRVTPATYQSCFKLSARHFSCHPPLCASNLLLSLFCLIIMSKCWRTQPNGDTPAVGCVSDGAEPHSWVTDKEAQSQPTYISLNVYNNS